MSNSDYRFSLWANLTDTKEPRAEWDVDDLLRAIRSGVGPNGSFIPSIQRLRQAPSKETKGKIKTFELPAVTLSGRFEPRSARGFIEHSGLMQVDIDDVSDYEKAIKTVQEDHYTFVCFRSPSGNGIKSIVKVNPEKVTHLEQFYALERHYAENLNLTIDSACKNIDRCMLLSWDEQIFVNVDAEVFAETFLPPKKENVQKQERKVYRTMASPGATESKAVLDQLLDAVEASQVDITGDYTDWYRIAYGLHSALGEAGRDYFHRLCRFYEFYSEDECNRQYDYASRTNNHSIRIGTILHVAAEHGIKLTPAFAKVAAEPPAPPLQSVPAKTVVAPVPKRQEIVSDKIKFSPQQEQLFDALKKFRLTLSREKGVKAFQIFSNNTLHELVWNQPMNHSDLLKCKGIGQHKLAEFGNHIIELIQEHS